MSLKIKYILILNTSSFVVFTTGYPKPMVFPKRVTQVQVW